MKKQRSGNPAYLPEIASLFFARGIFRKAFRLLFVCYFVDRFVGANGADIRFIFLKKALLFRSVPLPRTILP